MLSTLAHRALERDGLGPIRDTVLSGRRLTDDEALRLFEAQDLAAVGRPGRPRPRGAPRAPGLLQPERPPQPDQRLRRLLQVLLVRPQGRPAGLRGLHHVPRRGGGEGGLQARPRHHRGPHRGRAPPDAAVGLLHRRCCGRIHAAWPELTIKAFTAIEYHYWAEKFGKSYRAGPLRAPGGRPHHHPRAAAPRSSRRGCAGRSATTRRPPSSGWRSTGRPTALGMKSNATMLYGHIERLDERVDHMRRLRELQDETHGFQVFIPLAFHPEHNMIGKAYPKPTGYDALRTLAVARLYLDNFDHVKAYWVSPRRAAGADGARPSASTISTAPCSRSASTTWPARTVPQALSRADAPRAHPRRRPGAGRARLQLPRPQGPRGSRCPRTTARRPRALTVVPA